MIVGPGTRKTGDVSTCRTRRWRERRAVSASDVGRSGIPFIGAWVLIIRDDEMVNDACEVIAIEIQEGKDEEILECKIVGLCGVTEQWADSKGVRMMKLMGTVEGIPLVVLVDSGTGHNFISPEVVSVLGLRTDKACQMGVRLGDGHRIKMQGRCPVVNIQLGELKIVVDAYIMELGGIDIILGVRWLETLGKVVMNWKEMSMSFAKEGQTIKLCNFDRNQKSEDDVEDIEALRSIVGERKQVVDGLLWTIEREEQ